jgi:beta-glucosidase
LGLGYPVKDLSLLQRLEAYVKDGDEAKLAFNMDFIGLQNYTREIVSFSYLRPLLWAKIISADKRGVERTLMNWEVYPKSIYEMLHRYNKYENIPDLVVTENGAAFKDVVSEGMIYDNRRQQFLEDYIYQVLNAKQEGVKVKGYFAWSFTDNFEWCEGYRPTFGLVHVDFKSQKRTVKKSGYWYSRFLQSKVIDAYPTLVTTANT